MIKNGIKASKGYAIGQIVLLEQNEPAVYSSSISDISAELDKMNKAIELTRSQLIRIKDKTEKEIGKDEAAVFESHIMLLDDPEFTGAAITKIEAEKTSAENAVDSVVKMYADIFSAIEDQYMRERAADIKDVGNRLINNLSGKSCSPLSNLAPNSIVAANDLTPSDTAQLDKDKVVGFITNAGGKTSHSAIMARALEIPAVVGLVDITSAVKNGDTVIIDGTQGIVITDPDEETIAAYRQKQKDFEEEKARLSTLVTSEVITSEGKKITVAGNVGSLKDIDNVIKHGGEGIGLFRTEFIYMDRNEMPDEEEQFAVYRTAAEKMSNSPVIIRTLDIGGDKKLQYLPMPEEANPFLGYRAIRLCLDRKDIFKTQLRAILRASAYGNILIMFPMISSLEEFFAAKDVLNECMIELAAANKPFNKDIQTGIMVEIPSAAILADEFAKHVDFFSIGTNDLTQYTLAVDRMNQKIAPLYNSMHPAVLQLIKNTIEAAHRHGKWCGMCGELAGDEAAISTLMDYGLDEFSMSASSILKAKKIMLDLHK